MTVTAGPLCVSIAFHSPPLPYPSHNSRRPRPLR